MKKQYLECGKIINTHGIKGAVKIESWCDSPRVLASLKRLYFASSGKPGMECRKVLHTSVFGQFVLAELEGISTREEADLLRETVLYADRNDLPLKDGDYFISDLIGLSVVDADTRKVYGVVTDVINRGASDIYVIKTPDGEAMIPAVPEFIQSVDTEKEIVVTPIEGMFD